jgi:MFS family permease
MLWLPGLGLLVVAVLGLFAALRMPKLEPAAGELEVKWEFFAPYRRTIRNMLNAETPIFVVCLLKAGFFMTAYIVLLILADYTVVLAKSEAWVSFYVFGTVGVSIAVGSILAGFISRGGIQPRLIPVGTLGIMVCSVLLAFAPSSYVVIYPADQARAGQGLKALPADASVSFSQKRARNRLLELKPKLDLQNDESPLSERLARVKSGEVQAMIFTAANLDAFPHETVKSRKLKDGNSTAEYHALLKVDENGTVIKAESGEGHSGLVGVPVKLRSRDYVRILIYLFFVGMFAGMYVIPLQALIQKLSPVASRGQYIAASNAMDSVMNLCGIGSFFLLRNLGVQSQEIFFLTAFVAMMTSAMFFWKIRQHINNPEWR